MYFGGLHTMHFTGWIPVSMHGASILRMLLAVLHACVCCLFFHLQHLHENSLVVDAAFLDENIIILFYSYSRTEQWNGS